MKGIELDFRRRKIIQRSHYSFFFYSTNEEIDRSHNDIICVSVCVWITFSLMVKTKTLNYTHK